jgi:peroxiredoxin Q/BCP
VGISYDDPKTLTKVAQKLDIHFPLLSDAGSKTIDAYGLRNEEARGSRTDGIPHPTTVILDAKGVIRAKISYEGVKKRSESDEIIAAAQEID